MAKDEDAVGRPDGDAAGRRLLRQRAALADFGAAALSGADLDHVLAEAARLCAEALEVPFCKVLEPAPGIDGLLVRAGVGWEPGTVGRAVLPADAADPGGEAFLTGRPVVVPDLRAADGLGLPGLYDRHGVVSTANVPIPGGEGGRPSGVLEVDARAPRGFAPDEVDFLRRYADLVAGAVRARRREAAARAEGEVRAALLREQQHRVRNNLMAVAAMLRDGGRGATAEDLRARFDGARRRVFALASLYDHLLGAGLTGEETGLRDYLAALCEGARAFHGLAERGVDLRFEGDGDPLPTATAACASLGVVVNELVANAAEHAFGGGGRIAVGTRGGDGGGRGAAITVEDDGRGVPPGAENASVGLGLARGLAAQTGAALSLETRPGRTVWTIALPPRTPGGGVGGAPAA